MKYLRLKNRDGSCGLLKIGLVDHCISLTTLELQDVGGEIVLLKLGNSPLGHLCCVLSTCVAFFLNIVRSVLALCNEYVDYVGAKGKYSEFLPRDILSIYNTPLKNTVHSKREF